MFGLRSHGSNTLLWDVDTGHDLMISEPDAVAELLVRVAPSLSQAT